MSPSRLLPRSARPEALRPWRLTRFGHSWLVRIGSSKRFMVVGPHWLGVVATIVVILGGTVMNVRFLHKSKELSSFQMSCAEAFIAVFCLMTHVLLLMTALSDPGIVFPADQDTCGDEEQQPLHQHQHQHQRFYCEECRMLEPVGVRMDHCNFCGYCVRDMDHHCPWMGQCIGKSNMRQFILFNVTWVIFFVEFLFVVITLKV